MWGDIKCFIFIGICYLGIYIVYLVKWLLTNYRKHISIILISVILVSCAAPQVTITTQKAAVAYASVLSVMQYALPLFMVACVGVLIAKRTKEFKGCDEPIMPDMIEECSRLKESEIVRTQSIH